MIYVGGEWVYPQEVENTILAFDNISEVIVYREKNPLTGKIVCAKINTVVNRGDKKLFLKDLKAFCRTKLESFKVPVKIKIVEEKLHSTRFKKQRSKL